MLRVLRPGRRRLRLVRHAIRAQVARLAAIALVGAGLSGCLGSSSGSDGSHAGAHIGEVRLVNCREWNNADVRERYGTIADLKDFAGSPAGAGSATGPSGHGATLDDDKAYKLFENECSPYYARGFKLYKLYTRAAAFTP